MEGENDDMSRKRIQILAISGSLRTQSSNSALLRAITTLGPTNADFTIYGGLGDLPHFNPDLDSDDAPILSVMDLRTQLASADAVLICTPEYGNGVPGVLKNALDWIVSSGEFMSKPVAVISASPTPLGGDKAHASLLLTLNMVNATIVDGATMIIPYISLKLNKEGTITDLMTKEALRSLLDSLITSVQVV